MSKNNLVEVKNRDTITDLADRDAAHRRAVDPTGGRD